MNWDGTLVLPHNHERKPRPINTFSQWCIIFFTYGSLSQVCQNARISSVATQRDANISVHGRKTASDQNIVLPEMLDHLLAG